MLKIQNLIILIVLLATTLVNSVTEEEMRSFKRHLDYLMDINAGGANGINHLNSLSEWNKTPLVFREKCVEKYVEQRNERGLIEEANSYDLGQLAYRILDMKIQEIVDKDLKLIGNDRKLKRKLKSIHNNGEYLQFLAFRRGALNNRDVDMFLDLIKFEYRDQKLPEAQANLMAILQGYLAKFHPD